MSARNYYFPMEVELPRLNEKDQGNGLTAMLLRMSSGGKPTT